MCDSHMHFSITSKKIATDFLTNHAWQLEMGKVALVIDNNSGTFGPPKDKLDTLKLLMQLNFGTDIPTLALDREDPLLGELSEANGVE